MIGYQGHVIPVIISVWILSLIEKKLHKVVPAMLDLFVTPLVSVFITGYITLAAVGPVFVLIENSIIDGIQFPGCSANLSRRLRFALRCRRRPKLR